MSTSLKLPFGFRHGPGSSTETAERENLIKVLKWSYIEAGCADITSGLAIDMREIVIAAKEQNPTFKPNLRQTFVPWISGSVFDAVDDDMQLRLSVNNLMSKTQWRVPLTMKLVRIVKSSTDTLVVQLWFDYQEHILFNIFPMMLTRILPDSDLVRELGTVTLSVDYFFSGTIWLTPISMLKHS